MTPQELKQARLDAGLSQYKMARALEVSEITIRKWEASSEFTDRVKDNVELRVRRWQQGEAK